MYEGSIEPFSDDFIIIIIVIIILWYWNDEAHVSYGCIYCCYLISFTEEWHI